MSEFTSDELKLEMNKFDLEAQEESHNTQHCSRKYFKDAITLLDGPKEYRRFCSQFKSLPVLVLVVYVVVAVFIPLSAMAMLASNYQPQYISCFSLYLIFTVAITLTAITCKGNCRACHLSCVDFMNKYEGWIEIFYIYGISITNGIFLLSRILFGPCTSLRFEDQWHCNPSLTQQSLPASHYVLITFVPFAFVVLFRSTRWSIHFTAWFMSLTFIYVASCLLPVAFAVCWLVNISYTIIGAVIFFEVRRQSIFTYRLHKLLVASTDELNVLKEREYADEMRHLIGNVAHDLKTPLTAFVAGLEHINSICVSIAKMLPDTHDDESKVDTTIMNEESKFTSQIRRYLQDLFQVITHVSDTNQFMLMTVNRCVDHSKVANDVTLLASQSSFNLVEAVNFPVECIRRMQSNVGIVVNFDIDIIGKYIISDKLWFSENIFCLLSNAVKYSEGGSAELRITKVDANHPSRKILQANAIHRQLQSNVLDPFLLVEVIDSGKGIERDKISSIFAPFKQAQRRSGGTGLGLYAMACRMRALGGYYGVRQRTDNSGSIFWFAIPYKEDDTLPAPNDSHLVCDSIENDKAIAMPVSRMKDSCSNLSILLVDDAYPIQKVLSNILQRHGHIVDIAENGLKAIRILGVLPISEKYQPSSPHRRTSPDRFCKHYDVVLMDLQMPVMDGFEAIRCIRHSEMSIGPGHPRQFIIAMSANSDEGTVNDALKEGADYFMPKPFQIETFHKLYESFQPSA